MVEIVSGSGLTRILTTNEVQEDRVFFQNRARAADAQDRRAAIREAGLSRAVEAEALARAATADAAAAAEQPDDDTASRRPRFADLFDNPDAVNRVLEETQGVDRVLSEGERLRQAAVLEDAFRRSYFISLVDPGRAMTMISPRETATPLEDDS
ncbi:MAG: hypothetical protein CMM61_12160 [Rhodospirillaceae bacterium]|nr:hypothetical protein [Rhodospirillaceae bacterium]